MNKKEEKPFRLIPIGPPSRNEFAKIDSEDFDRVMKHKWRARTTRSGRKLVVTTLSGGGQDRQVTLGWFLMRPPKDKQVYPRRFMNGFDYRKDNLIICTMQERQRILPKNRKRGTSRYKGVSFITSKRRWRATIQLEGKTRYIGLFVSEEEAGEAYNEAARRHFGELAYQNQVKPQGPERRGPEPVREVASRPPAAAKKKG